MNICVIGLGKIGLPLAVHFAKQGHQVIGADINPRTVNLINAGTEPFPEEENLQLYLSEVVQNGSLKATTNNLEAVSKSEVVIVVVPLFVDGKANPDFQSMDAVTLDIANGINEGTLVIYETTLPIGTTRDRFLPTLEKYSGLNVGSDFNLVFSPERVLTGRIFSDLVRYPKIVGGITESCTDAGVKFYEQVIQFEKRMDLSKPNGAWAVESTEAAEFVKLAETTYRDVNIGLANQFAKFAIGQGLNIHAIIAACNSQPYSHIHRPGISVGGHCIPIYPQFYLWNDPEATIVSAARTVNESMPEYYVNKLAETLGALKGKSILVLGVAYRPKVKEVAFSGAYRVRDELQTRGATAYFMDPLYTKHELSALGFTPVDEQVKIDGVILHTDHEGIKDWKQLKIQLEGVPMIDGRNHPEFLEL